MTKSETTGDPRILTVDEVLATYARCSKAQLYRMIGQGIFPQPLRLSKQHVGWRLAEVLEWMETRTSGVKRRHARHQPAQEEL